MELREKIIAALECVPVKAGQTYAEAIADIVQAIPEIRGALASVALLEGEHKMFANYRADMGRLINGNEKA